MNLIKQLVNLVKREQPGSERAYVSPRQAGVYVDEDRALTNAAVWGCVRIISETIASLPWRAHRKLEPRGSQVLGDSALDYILHVEANPEQSAFSFRETILGHALLWGNGYAEIERDSAGRVYNLWTMPADKWHADRTADGRLWYITQGQPVVESGNMFHLKGLGFDGISGYPVISMAARSVGLGMALDSMAANTFQNGGFPGLIISQKENGKALSPEGVENLIKSFEKRFQGPSNANKVGYLDAGLSATVLEMPLTDLQFLESRKFQISEIARWFRVPPHKLADLDRATFSNIEHQSLEFVTDALVPWITRLESEAQIKLIGRNNRMGRIYTKISTNALVRGDIKSRYDAYAVLRDRGVLSANDIRELEDMNPVEGGDEYLVQSQMMPQDMLREHFSKSVAEEPGQQAQPTEPAASLRAVK